MTPLEKAYLDWIMEHDLFNARDRARIAREFAVIARQFGAGEDAK